MKLNLALWDRAFRYFIGFVLNFWAAAGGPWWAWSGCYLLLTAAWGFCPAYSFFGLRTAPDFDVKLEIESEGEKVPRS